MKVLEELLEDYWILNDQDNEKYEQIRQELDDKTVNFIKQKLGYKLIINPYLIKLEKRLETLDYNKIHLNDEEII